MLLWDEDEYGTSLFHSVIFNSVGAAFPILGADFQNDGLLYYIGIAVWHIYYLNTKILIDT